MKKVLVTGASGFIGKVLVPYLLEQGYTVRCLVRASSNTAPLEALGVELAQGDLADKASLSRAMQGVDVVYHLAAQINMSVKESFSAVNGAGTANVMEAAAEQKLRPVVLGVSSLAATGPRSNKVKPTEADPLQPVSEYGKSKAESEKFLRAYADRLDISIVRPPMVLGAGDALSLPLFKNIKMGIHPTIDKQQLFSMVYVKDLVRLMVRIAEQGERISPVDSGDGKGIYFPGFADAMTWEELGAYIALALGKKSSPVNIIIPKPLLKFLASLMDKLSAIFNTTMPLSKDKALEGMSGNWMCDVEKGYQQFDFEPSQTIDEAFREIVDGYKAMGML